MAEEFQNPKEYIAELIGTALLVGFGCFAGAMAGGFIAAIVFALAFIGMVYCAGGLCGCHFNPLISLSMFISGKMNAKDMVFYVLAQIIGGIIGGIFAFYLLTQTMYTSNVAVYPDVFGKDFFMVDWVGCIIAEIVLGIILSFVVMKASESKYIDMKSGAIVAVAIFGLVLIGTYLSDTAVNPAKSIGTAFAMLFSGIEDKYDPLIQLWMFIIFPVIGAVIGTILYLIACNDEFDINAYINDVKEKQAAKKAAKEEAKAAAEAEAAEAAEAEEVSEEEPVADEPAEEEPAEETVETSDDSVPEIESVEEEKE